MNPARRGMLRGAGPSIARKKPRYLRFVSVHGDKFVWMQDTCGPRLFRIYSTTGRRSWPIDGDSPHPDTARRTAAHGRAAVRARIRGSVPVFSGIRTMTNVPPTHLGRRCPASRPGAARDARRPFCPRARAAEAGASFARTSSPAGRQCAARPIPRQPRLPARHGMRRSTPAWRSNTPSVSRSATRTDA